MKDLAVFEKQVAKGFNLTKEECAVVSKAIVQNVLEGNQNVFPVARNLKSMETLVKEIAKGLKETLVEKMKESTENTIYVDGTAFTKRERIDHTFDNSSAIIQLNEKLEQIQVVTDMLFKPIIKRIKELEEISKTITEMVLVEEGELYPSVKSEPVITVAITLAKE